MLLHLLSIGFINVPEVEKSTKRKITKVTLWNSPKKEKQKEIEKPEEELKGQIIDLPPDEDSEKPDEAKFLSETNHKTEKESVSKHQTNTDQSGHERTTQAHNQEKATDELGKEGDAEVDKSKKSPSKTEQQDRLNLEKDSSSHPRNREGISGIEGSEMESQTTEEQGEQKSGPREINIFPDLGTLSQAPSAPMNDHIEDVEEGEGTFLNTHAFKYAGFFNRVKRDVSSMWRPLPILRMNDPTGKKYGHLDRNTVLSVTLDSEGYIIGVAVKQSSGVEVLDNEAIAAFMRCRQFPNPPKGMVEDGRIKFDFGFHVSFKGGGLRF